MVTSEILCTIALALWTAEAPSWYQPRIPAMQETCEEVATAAQERGIDPALIISLAWEESRFRWVTSSAGAVGPLQALPELWCPDKVERGCDLIEAGLDAWEAFSERWPNEFDTACHYNGGNRCGPRSIDYAQRVMTRYYRLTRELDHCQPCGC